MPSLESVKVPSSLSYSKVDIINFVEKLKYIKNKKIYVILLTILRKY